MMVTLRLSSVNLTIYHSMNGIILFNHLQVITLYKLFWMYHVTTCNTVMIFFWIIIFLLPDIFFSKFSLQKLCITIHSVKRTIYGENCNIEFPCFPNMMKLPIKKKLSDNEKIHVHIIYTDGKYFAKAVFLHDFLFVHRMQLFF